MDGSAPGVQKFNRPLIVGLGINAATTLYTLMILDGGWTFACYRPFAIAHFVTSWLMWFRARRHGRTWTAVDLAFLQYVPLIGFVVIVLLA